MSQNSIPALKAMVSLQHTASSGQQAITAGSTIKVAHSKNSVSFTILAANAQQVVVQDNANKQRFNLPSNAITSDTQPKTGDTLVLINANEKRLSFRLIPAVSGQTLAPVSNLPVALNRPLVDSWPDINLSVVAKGGLNIAAKTDISLNDPALTQVARVLTQNAVKSGQPMIEIPVTAKLGQIISSPSGNPIAEARLALPANLSQKITLTLPIPSTLLATLKAGSEITLLLSPNQKEVGIKAISLENGKAFSTNDVLAVNRANPSLNQAIKAISPTLLFDNNQRPEAFKFAPALSFVQPLQSKLLNALPKDFSAQIRQAITPQQLADARIVISTDASLKNLNSASQPALNNAELANAKGPRADTRVSLVAITKPLVLDIKTQSISPKNISGLSAGLITPSQSVTANIDKAHLDDNIKSNSWRTKFPLTADASAIKTDTLASNVKQQTSMLNTAMLQTKIQNAFNQNISKVQPSAPLLQSISSQLDTIASGASAETRALLTPIKQQISVILEQGSNDATKLQLGAGTSIAQDTENTNKQGSELSEILRTIISSQAVSHVNQATPARSQNSFIDGLVTLLKMSLAAKLATSTASNRNIAQTAQRPAELAPQIAAFAGNMLKQIPNKAERPNPARVLQDIALGDPKASLISSIGKLISGHNAQKLRSAEASLQGQDTCYYSLPNILNPENEDIEIALKREYQEGQKGEQNTTQTTWKLDMKLDIGKYGTVLAKTRLTITNENQGIDLHFYASNESLKTRIKQYLPLLHRRLDSLGIALNSQKCDVGKVDASLFKTQLNVMHAYA